MADDIVTRLRTAAVGMPQDDMNQTAADEIERLRGEINSMASAQAGWGRVARLEAEIERLEAEIERLRAALMLAVGELSTHAQYAMWAPDQLLSQLLEEARRG